MEVAQTSGYGKYLGESLKRFFEPTLSSAHSLCDEVELYKTFVKEALYKKAICEKSKDLDLQALAQDNVEHWLEKTRVMVLTSARVQQMSQAPNENLGLMLEILGAVLTDKLSALNVVDVSAVVRDIGADLDAQLALGSQGTVITPDQDVQGMDSTIPYYQPKSNGKIA